MQLIKERNKMGWSIGFIDGRDVGYKVPSACDYPDCKKKIDRGLSYACGGYAGDNEYGCGQFFCGKHLDYYEDKDGDTHAACDVCCHNMTLQEGFDYEKDWLDNYPIKPDLNVWLRWKLKHSSWKKWRDENPAEVLRIKSTLGIDVEETPNE